VLVDFASLRVRQGANCALNSRLLNVDVVGFGDDFTVNLVGEGYFATGFSSVEFKGEFEWIVGSSCFCLNFDSRGADVNLFKL